VATNLILKKQKISHTVLFKTQAGMDKWLE
jgi:hypothetical protein